MSHGHRLGKEGHSRRRRLAGSTRKGEAGVMETIGKQSMGGMEMERRESSCFERWRRSRRRDRNRNHRRSRGHSGGKAGHGEPKIKVPALALST